MFPLALYVEEMAFFRTPLGKTFPELFYLTIVEASRPVKPGHDFTFYFLFVFLAAYTWHIVKIRMQVCKS